MFNYYKHLTQEQYIDIAKEHCERKVPLTPKEYAIEGKLINLSRYTDYLNNEINDINNAYNKIKQMHKSKQKICLK